MKTAFKIFLAVLLSAASLFLVCVSAFYIVTAGVKLEPQKLICVDKTAEIFDADGNKIESASTSTGKKSVKMGELKEYTKNAFIASEDREFFTHNGLNYKRMAKAAFKNLCTLSFKEGASTISQQLIKNTHLSNDKTIKRKLKEIRLTKKLERAYSKEQILEMYLNTIYFGHNCYGLESAANFYFSKSADELNLEQSAALVGLLTSPNNYSPFKNEQLCIRRRNTVLSAMKDCNFIDEKTCKHNQKLPLSVVKNVENGKNSSYLHFVYEELNGLNIDPYGQFSKLKIKTFLNSSLQSAANENKTQCDKSVFIRDGYGRVLAHSSDLTVLKRQIGSTAKPILVYAPAIESNKLHLFSKIKDEFVNYNGYSPENHDKKYHGSVTVKEAIANSYNVPAVKTLNQLNLEEVKELAKKMNITLEDSDKNLSLALGATQNGISLKQICDAYTVFANGGNFNKSHYIDEICDQNGKILYKFKQNSQKIFSQGTASLINEALIETTKSGTAKKLKGFNFDVACKTGTCGNAEGNTDAYSIAYTSDLCIGVWLGDADGKRSDVTGGKDCCEIVKKILERAYKDKKPAPLDVSCGTQNIEIDRDEYEQNDRIILSDINAPKLNKMTVKIKCDNLPKETSTRFSHPFISQPQILVEKDKIIIRLCQTKYYSYIIKRDNIVIYDGKFKQSIEDIPCEGVHDYSVIPYYKSSEKTFYGDEIHLKKIKISPSATAEQDEKLPDILYKDWTNL